MTQNEKLEKLAEIIKNSNNIVFFGGAGVSTESNIPDFRSVDGLYNQKYDYPPEEILSHDFFINNTEEFYRFYRDKMIFPRAEPNNAHVFLKKLEDLGKLTCIITQNIDNLHFKAGSKTVYELHGSVYRNYCQICHKAYSLDYILNTKGIPKCSCNGIIKPDVVLYGEGLDELTMTKSIDAISKADVLIVGGTSLNVYPAAGFLNYFRGDHLVLINRSKTQLDESAEIAIDKNIGEAFLEISKLLSL